MTVYTDTIQEQMKRSRYRNGRHERLENGEWVPWPVLTIDKYGREEADRTIGHRRQARLAD
jgi:hypothetical protein